MSTIPGMLTRSEAADRVRRSERTIRSWEKHGLRTVLGLFPEAALLDFDRRMRASRGRPAKPGSVLKRFISGDYAEVFATLTAHERETLADELTALAEFVAGAARGRAASA